MKATEDSSQVHVSNVLHIGPEGRDEGGTEMLMLGLLERLGLHNQRHSSILREPDLGPDLSLCSFLQLDFLLT